MNRREKEKITELARKARVLSRILAWALGAVFAFLKLSDIPVIELASDESANFLLRAIMVAYYFIWIVGTSWDAKDIELVYVTAPNQGRLPIAVIGLSVAIAVVFGILCWVTTPEGFALTLGCFWLLTFAAWYYMSHIMLRDARQESIRYYEDSKDFMGLVKFRLVDEAIMGSWQIRRFLIGVAVLVYLNIQVHTDLSSSLAAILGLTSVEFVQVALLALFLIVFEMQMMLKRTKRKAGLLILNELERDGRYHFHLEAASHPQQE